MSSQALLDDPLVPVATREILADGKERSAVQREIKAKEKARDQVRECVWGGERERERESYG